MRFLNLALVLLLLSRCFVYYSPRKVCAYVSICIALGKRKFLRRDIRLNDNANLLVGILFSELTELRFWKLLLKKISYF